MAALKENKTKSGNLVWASKQQRRQKERILPVTGRIFHYCRRRRPDLDCIMDGWIGRGGEGDGQRLEECAEGICPWSVPFRSSLFCSLLLEVVSVRTIFTCSNNKTGIDFGSRGYRFE